MIELSAGQSLIPIGAKAWVSRSVYDHRRPIPLILQGEEVTIVRHAILDSKHGVKQGYLVRTANDMEIYALADDLTGDKPQPPRSLEQIARDAFLRGYSEGHSRGLTCGKLYGADDQYGQVIQVATRGYIRELRGEDA